MNTVRTSLWGGLWTFAVATGAGSVPAVVQTGPEIVLDTENDTTLFVHLSGLDADGRFIGAMHDGFPLYIEYRVELRESRGIWFDRSAAEEIVEFVVSFDPVRNAYVVDDQLKTQELRGEAQLLRYLGQVYRIVFERPRPGEYYYAVTVDARTLSDADVDEVYDWLRGEDGEPRQQRGILTRAARRLLVEVAPLPRWNGREETERVEFR